MLSPSLSLTLSLRVLSSSLNYVFNKRRDKNQLLRSDVSVVFGGKFDFFFENKFRVS